MRVIAGEARSLRLSVPKRVRLRPTSDAVREALFSSLGDRVVGCRFLDVYAGTGAVGIEALSRGAIFCAFVERNRPCVEAISRNLANTHLSERALVVHGDARQVTVRVLAAHGPFGVVFLDPPYDDPGAGEVARAVLDGSGTEPPGLLILQHSRHAALAGLPEPERTRRFGDTVLSTFAIPPVEG